MNQRFIKVRFNSYLRNYMNKKCVKYLLYDIAPYPTQNNGGTKDEYRCVGKEYCEVS